MEITATAPKRIPDRSKWCKDMTLSHYHHQKCQVSSASWSRLELLSRLLKMSVMACLPLLSAVCPQTNCFARSKNGLSPVIGFLRVPPRRKYRKTKFFLSANQHSVQIATGGRGMVSWEEKERANWMRSGERRGEGTVSPSMLGQVLSWCLSCLLLLWGLFSPRQSSIPRGGEKWRKKPYTVKFSEKARAVNALHFTVG